MGITGLLPFIDKASRRVNVSEFNGCTVAIDSYCWLHKGAFACADRLVRGEETDVHIKYCMKYVNMLLSKNIKPILVFDGRHLPAKAMTESKRRESRNTSRKRAAELLSLGKIEEARSYMRRSVDITHEMALCLIKECRSRNVDCIVAPYEADAQLAYLNIKNIAHLVITEDSDLILFGCTKVLFKMDLDGTGTLVETVKLPLAMKCPIEQYTFDKFRQMCIMSGCDYLASLPGIGLAKARQFVTATQDSNFANALKKLPSFFNRSSLNVTDEYRENFLKAEATFKHQFVYDPIERQMVRLTEVDDEEIELALCVNAGELLEPKIAFQLALGNLDPFTLKKMDDWHPDHRNQTINTQDKKSNKSVANHTSIWSDEFRKHIDEETPWLKKVKQPERVTMAAKTRPRKKVVNMVTKYVPETQDESLSIQTLSNMYCIEPNTKRQKLEDSTTLNQNGQTANNSLNDDEILNEVKDRSPILQNKERSFRKGLKNGSYSVLKRLSRFPRTILDNNVVESKFFSTPTEVPEKDNSIIIEESPEKNNDIMNDNVNATAVNATAVNATAVNVIDVIDDSGNESSQKENSPYNSPVKTKSPILEPSPRSRNPFKLMDVKDISYSEDSVIENTYPMETLVTPVDSQESFGQSPPKPSFFKRSPPSLPASQPNKIYNVKKSTCRVPGLKRSTSLPTNQPTLLSKFGFQKKPVLKR